MSEVIKVPKMFEELLPNFLEDRIKLVNEMQELIKKNDYNEIKSLAHQIAGSAGSFGFHKTTDLASQIESCIDQKQLDELATMITELKSSLVDVTTEIVED